MKTKENVKCVWKEDDPDNGSWVTSCEERHYFSEDGVKENNYKYCPYCGKVIDPVKYVSDWG